MMKYFESFKLGEIYQLREYRVSEAEILEFANKYDPQSYHTEGVKQMRSQQPKVSRHFPALKNLKVRDA